MRRDRRLRRRADFAAAYRSGKVEGSRLLVVRVRPNGQAKSRVGFVAGKVVGGAVVRNKVKRRLRAVIDGLQIVEGLDIVVGARRTAADADYASLRRSLVTLLGKAKVLPTPVPSQEKP